ncbi:MAG TPA: ATP-binding protein [Anaerolineales bacterium]|nr:ATP-binding protein [Anaerolineales bacterium]
MTENSTRASYKTRFGHVSKLFERLRPLFSLPSLQSKLTVPYALLTLILTAVGIFVLTRLVTSSIRERFMNQLYEAGRAASDGIVLQEKKHLENLRIMSYTTGVAGALTNRDTRKLETLLLPIALNDQVEMLTLIDTNGTELLTLTLDPTSGKYVRSAGQDFSSLPLAEKILKGEIDDTGDKFAGLLQTRDGIALFTSAAVLQSDGQPAGVLLVGTSLDHLVSDLKTRALADIILLDETGKLLSTTLPPEDRSYEGLEQTARRQVADHSTQSHNLTLYGRGYQVVYAPLMIRGEKNGWLGVLLPDQFVVSTEATSRNSLSLIFTFGTLMVLLIGRLVALNIARPILWLRKMAEDVARGNLHQSIKLGRADEVGELADSFNIMTLQLRERTDEAKTLLEESIQRNQELAETNTRLRDTQMQLVRSEKMAAVGQLTAGIVHDVKNPLAAIQGMTDMLLMDPKLPDEARQDIGIIHNSVVNATKIVTDLLKFARQAPPEFNSQDLRETIHSALYLNQYLIRKANVKVITEVSDRPIIVNYDAVQIEQVLMNLIQNAVHAMPQGGELKVVLVEENGTAKIGLFDTGVGIPSENLKRIFDPFFTTKENGTGLGLSTSYGIIASHHGEIHVQSQVGRGTCFTILLPLEFNQESTRSYQMKDQG